MKERIHLFKEVNEALYQNTHPVDDRKTRRNLSEAARFAHLPPLPPTLPRPKYSLTADLISLADEEVRFYVACENGSVEEVASVIQQTNSPSQAVLQHGADPNIAADSRSPDGEEPPLNRHGGDALNSAARLDDTQLFNLLLSHGADASFASPLHSIVSCQIMPADLRGGWLDTHSFAQTPFSPRRREMAAHILESGAAGVNDVRRLLYCDILDRQPGDSYETTAFARACAGQDWEFAEWLLEKGADPGLCMGLALLRQYWSEPWVGPTEPEAVRELIERVKGRKA
ncbi:hypothetical protein CGCVW01_v000724 [Colletotrichum viniferum]|nr:hypothetical protein CGCVW01_v000724 [Colletotrichum viniferum]